MVAHACQFLHHPPATFQLRGRFPTPLAKTIAQRPLTTPSVMETRDLGETTSFSPMAGKAGIEVNFCQALEKQHRNVLIDKKIETAFINPIQTCSHSPALGFGHNWIKYGDYSLSEQPTLIRSLLTVWRAHPASQLCLPPGSPSHTMPGYHKKGHQPLFSVRSNLSLRAQHTSLSDKSSDVRKMTDIHLDLTPVIHNFMRKHTQAKPWSPQLLHGTFPPGQSPQLSQNMGVRKQSSSLWHTTTWWTGKSTPIMRHIFFIFLWIIPKDWGQSPWMEEVELKRPASTFNRNSLQHLIARKPRFIALQYQ